MEPIISPLWFYLINVVSIVRAVIVLLGLLLLTVLLFMSFTSDTLEDFMNFWKGKAKKGLLVSLLLIMLGCFIPNDETAYKMLVASFVTPDNVAAMGDSASNIVDYIIESVDKLIELNQ